MYPIRILQILPTLNKGSGIANVIYNWHKNIDRTKVQFDYLYFLDTPVNFEKEINELGGNIYKLPNPSILKPLIFIKAVIIFFKNHRYKTIHSHITHLNFFYFPIAKFYKVKNIILHAHGIKYSNKIINGIRNRFMIGCVRPFITHKLACSDKSGKVWYGKNNNFIIINNGVKIDKFVYNPIHRQEMRAKFNIKNNFIIGHIGRFTHEKNHNFIIDIFLEIYKQNNKALLMLVGDGPLKKEIETKVMNLNLEQNVKFMGVCHDVTNLYQAMDCLILPSFQEGFPVVAVEAQTSGLPCIFSDIITNKVIICNSKQMSLKDSTLEWANEILKYQNFIRKNETENIKNANFDIKTISKQLECFYLNLYKIKVLHTLSNIDAGGVETFVINLYKGIDKNLFQFDCSIEYLFDKKNFLIQEFIKEEINLYPFTNHKGFFWYIKNLSNIIKEHGPYDIIEAPSHFFNGIILFIAWLHRIPVRISHSHNTSDGKKLNFKRKFYHFIMRHLISLFATDLIACSEEAGKALYGNKLQFKVINNPINLSKFAFNIKTRNLLRSELNLNNNFVIGHIGRFDIQKNHDFLIEIFREILLINKMAILLLVGAAPNKKMQQIKKNIENKIKEYNLTEKVLMLPPRKNVSELYQAMDCFILPSIYEGLGIVAIEAQCSGLPCFLSNMVPKEAFVINTKKCFLSNTPKEWAIQILEFIKHIKRKNESDILEKAGFSIKIVSEQMSKIYMQNKL
ncbi:MAG: glycosyltransferase [Endomicrobiaceae bacterium]|nr:glycosyltransferase [Endomicrobiaceae bacterium]